MKSLQLKGWTLLLATAFIGTLIVSSNKSASAQATNRDTVPKKAEKKIRDLDEALMELEKAEFEMEKSLKNFDWKKMEAELQESMKKLELDMAKMKVDIEKSMKEIDMSKIKADIDASMAKVDWKKIEKEMEKVKEIDLNKVKLELEKLQPELEKTMKDAQESLEKAKAELKEYQVFIDGLDKDGLIDKEKEYRIEHRNNQLTINGQVQPAEVYNRYRNFLEKHKTLTIKKTADDFDIEND